MSSHQTVRIGLGSHPSPEQGACVMEVASMLAGERFTARPRATCSVIAELLRTYNDAVDDARRQRLYPLAALVVGSCAGPDVVAGRAARLREEALAHGDSRSGFQRLLQGPRMQRAGAREAATCAGRALAADGERGLERLHALVAELVAMPAAGPEPAMLLRPAGLECEGEPTRTPVALGTPRRGVRAARRRRRDRARHRPRRVG
jgi:hypothetical protein